jgi:hypothetical protein
MATNGDAARSTEEMLPIKRDGGQNYGLSDLESYSPPNETNG